MLDRPDVHRRARRRARGGARAGRHALGACPRGNRSSSSSAGSSTTAMRAARERRPRRRPSVCDGVGCTARVKGVLLAVPRHAAAIGDDCARAEVVVLNVPRPKSECEGEGTGDRLLRHLAGRHARALHRSGRRNRAGPGTRRVRIETVAAHRGERPWAPVLAKARRSKAGHSRAGRSRAGRCKRTPAAMRTTAAGADKRTAERAPPRTGRSTRDLPRGPDWLAPASPRPEIEDDDDEDTAGKHPRRRAAGARTAVFNSGASARRAGPGCRPDRARKCAS